MSYNLKHTDKINPQLRKRFFVWLRFVLRFMPVEVRKKGLKAFRKDLESEYKLYFADLETHGDFCFYALEFRKLVYSNSLAKYYGIENLFNLVSQIDKEFESFFKTLNHESPKQNN